MIMISIIISTIIIIIITIIYLFISIFGVSIVLYFIKTVNNPRFGCGALTLALMNLFETF